MISIQERFEKRMEGRINNLYEYKNKIYGKKRKFIRVGGSIDDLNLKKSRKLP